MILNQTESIFYILVSKIPKILFFEIWELIRKIKTDVDRLLLILTMKKNIPIGFAKIKLIFFTISQILEKNFYVLDL